MSKTIAKFEYLAATGAAQADSYGNVLIDSGITHRENGTVNGSAQLPPGL